MSSKARVRATDRSGEWPGTLAAATALAVVVLSPIAWGCVDGRDRALLTAVLCGLGAIGAVTMLLRGTRLRWAFGALPLVCFVLFAFLQCAPLGVTLPDSLAAVVGTTSADALSLVPGITASRARDSAGLLVLFFVSAQLLSHPRRIKRLPWTLLVVGCILAVWFLSHPFLEHVPAAESIPFADDGYVFGTYLNRNHAATLFVLALLMGAGLFLTRRKTMVRRSDSFGRRQAFILVMCATCAAGLVATGSRGAITSCALGAMTLAALQLRRMDWKRRFVPAACVLGCIAAVGLALPDEILERFRGVGTEIAAGTRPRIWTGALDLFAAAPLSGTGLGTFGQVSALTQDAGVAGHVQHVHSDPIQFLAETGIVGANLLVWAALAWVLPVWRRSGQTRGDRRAVLASAAVAALVAMLLHSSVDFPLQIPVLACWAAALAGAASGAMANAHGLVARDHRLPRWVLVPIAIVLGTCAVFSGNEAWSRQITAQAETPAELARAQAIHAAGGLPLIRAAGLYVAAGDWGRAHHAATTAVAVHPFSSAAWRALGLAMLHADDPGAADALARAVALTPPSHRERRRTELGLAILRARRPDIARLWFQELLADPRADAMSVLRQLHRDAPIDVDLSVLIPVGADDLLAEYAALLLRAGEFDRREAVLDRLLDRTPIGGSFTVRDRVRLTDKRVIVHRETTHDRVEVRFEFHAPAGYEFDSQNMCLSVHGEAGRAELWFRPEVGPTSLSLDLPTWLPPGPYDLGLAAFTNGPRFPLAFLRVHERRASFLPGANVDPRDLLYFAASDPRLLPPEDAGLPVQQGERLWRPLHLGEAGGEVVVESSDPVTLRFEGEELPYLGRLGTRGYRFALPRDRAAGVLEVSNPGQAALVVLRVMRIAGGAR